MNCELTCVFAKPAIAYDRSERFLSEIGIQEANPMAVTSPHPKALEAIEATGNAAIPPLKDGAA